MTDKDIQYKLAFVSKSAVLIISGILTSLLFYWLQNLSKVPAGGPGIINLQLAFSLHHFNEILQAWGPDAVRQFQHTMWIDYFYAVAYGIFLSGVLFSIGSRLQIRPKRLLFFAWLPLVASLLDWTENTIHLILLREGANDAGVLLASVIASVKWWLLIQSVLLIMIGLSVLLLKKKIKI